MVLQPPVWSRLNHQLHDRFAMGPGGGCPELSAWNTAHSLGNSILAKNPPNCNSVVPLLASSERLMSRYLLSRIFSHIPIQTFCTQSFGRFSAHSTGVFLQERGKQHRHTFNQTSFPLFHPVGFPITDKYFLENEALFWSTCQIRRIK